MFDLFVILSAKISPLTGLPFVYSLRNQSVEQILFSPEEFIIPEKYRRYVHLSRDFLKVYIEQCDPNCPQISTDQFLTNFPAWNYVYEKLRENHDDLEWTETNHEEFREMLLWLSSKYIFSMAWMY